MHLYPSEYPSFFYFLFFAPFFHLRTHKRKTKKKYIKQSRNHFSVSNEMVRRWRSVEWGSGRLLKTNFMGNFNTSAFVKVVAISCTHGTRQRKRLSIKAHNIRICTHMNKHIKDR